MCVPRGSGASAALCSGMIQVSRKAGLHSKATKLQRRACSSFTRKAPGRGAHNPRAEGITTQTPKKPGWLPHPDSAQRNGSHNPPNRLAVLQGGRYCPQGSLKLAQGWFSPQPVLVWLPSGLSFFVKHKISIGQGFAPDSYKRIWVLISSFFPLSRSLSLSGHGHQKSRACACGTETLPFLETPYLGSELSSMRCGCLPQILLVLQNMASKSSPSVHKAHLPPRFLARDPQKLPRKHTQAVWAAEATGRVQAPKVQPGCSSCLPFRANSGLQASRATYYGSGGVLFTLLFPFGK